MPKSSEPITIPCSNQQYYSSNLPLFKPNPNHKKNRVSLEAILDQKDKERIESLNEEFQFPFDVFDKQLSIKGF